MTLCAVGQDSPQIGTPIGITRHVGHLAHHASRDPIGIRVGMRRNSRRGNADEIETQFDGTRLDAFGEIHGGYSTPYVIVRLMK